MAAVFRRVPPRDECVPAAASQRSSGDKVRHTWPLALAPSHLSASSTLLSSTLVLTVFSALMFLLCCLSGRCNAVCDMLIQIFTINPISPSVPVSGH